MLKDSAISTAKTCSCRQRSNCTLAKKFLSECLAYHAQVNKSEINQIKSYYGTCIKKIQRALQQLYSFFEKNKEKSKEFSKYICELENNSKSYDLKWSIACETRPYTGVTIKADLCLTEKLAITKADTIH